jgi:hypothetical protein
MTRTISYTIDDPVEDGNVAGWVRKGHDEPDWVPTKLVSEARTRRRWAEVAKAYPEIGPPVVVPPGTPPEYPPLGDLAFGVQQRTFSSTGPSMVYFRMIVPRDAMLGSEAMTAVYEFGLGQKSLKTYVTRTPGSRPQYPAYGEGNSPNVNMVCGPGTANAVGVSPGETIYLCIYPERMDGHPSVNPAELWGGAITLHQFR